VWVERRQKGVGERVLLALEDHRVTFQVDLRDHGAVLHVVFRMAGNHLGFELKLDDGNGLLHAGHLYGLA
jgi:hypothetical protein